MDETLESIKWSHHIDPEPFGELPSPHSFHVQPGYEKRLVILFPGVSKETCSGGPNTILRFAGEAAANGVRVICVSLQIPAFLPKPFQEHLVRELGVSPEAASRMEVYSSNNNLWLNRGDRIMATASWTFPLAKVLAKRCGQTAPAYFIQDLEPLFLGLGLGHAWLMETYHERYLPIINTPSLARALFNIGNGSFATERFRDSALVFTPAVDRNLFYPDNQPREKKIIFLYTRLNGQESRNMPELALEAVNRMCWEGLLDPAEWEIHCYGSPEAPPFIMRNGIITKMLPFLTLKEYADELRSASLALAFVLSPHPGYAAFELAASGVPVITNTCLTKTTELMTAISPLIHAVRPTYDAVTAKLRRLLLEKAYEIQGIASVSLKLPSTWRDSFAPLMPRFMEWFENK